jgi:lipoprotein-releasing system permease protein
LLDLGLLLVTPLVPTLVLYALRRPDNTTPPPDQYLHEIEGTGMPVASRLLGHGWSGPLLLALPAALLLAYNLFLLLRHQQTLGQRIVGLAWSRDGERRPVIGIVAGRVLLFAVLAIVLGRLLPATPFKIPVPARTAFAWLGLLAFDGMFALRSGRSTLRDAIFQVQLVPVVREHLHAFEPPRFSGVAFVVAGAGMLASLFISACVFGIASHFSNFESTDIDIPSVAAGCVLPLGMILTGALAAYKARRFVVGELAVMSLLTALIAFEGMIWDIIQAPALQRFMSPGVVDFAVYALIIYFGSVIFLIIGSALGFMVASDRGADFSTRFERLVARRHLRLKLEHWAMLAVIATLAPILIYGVFIWPFIAVRRLMRHERVARPLPPTVFMALLTIVGVMFGVTSLTVVLGVMGGFERDLKEKILGTTAHGIVQNFAGNFGDWRDVQKKIASVPGVAGATPFIYGEVMITTSDSVTGAILHGVDPTTISQVTNLDKSIANKGDGRLSDLTFPDRIPKHVPHVWDDLPGDHKDDKKGPGAETSDQPVVLPGIIIGREMAHSLNVWVGDQVTVMNPLGEIGPSGPIPRSLAFRVAAVFVTGMFEYDQKFAYIDLHEAQKFFRIHDEITGIELRFTNVDDARHIMKRILSLLGGFPYRGKDWGQMNQNLFSALRLERVVMFVLLSFQVLIACICVIATLVMLVIEKRKEVATLKAMGAREGSIMKLFVLEGLIIGAIGTFYGSAAGYLFCKLIEKFGVGLNPEIYYIEKLPVVIEPSAFISVAAVAMLLVFIATIYPARRGGSIAPVEGFREE